MHLLWVFTFDILIFLSIIVKDKKKWFVLIVEWIFAGICIVDYSLASFRGIGLVNSDLYHIDSVFNMIAKNGVPKGKKLWICIFVLLCCSLFSITKEYAVKNKKVSRILCGLIVILVSLLGVIVPYPNQFELFRGNAICGLPHYDDETAWDKRDRAIIHALGATADAMTLTNSYNALEFNYAKGARIFETDISFTSDKEPVLRHDWGSDLGQAEAFGWTEGNTYAVSYSEFMNTPIYGKYAPMSLLDLYKFMSSHKDVYVVTDMKLSEDNPVEEQYNSIVSLAINNGMEEVLERLVIQLYYYDMYNEVTSIYPFKNTLLTLYVIGMQPKDELRNYLLAHKMGSVTMPQSDATKELCGYLKDYDINVYTHTVNEISQVSEHFENGVYGIYTDVFMPYELNSIYSNLSNR